MKRYITFATLAFALLQGNMAQTIVKPSVQTKTTFAIVTDSKSYEEAKPEIDAYRASVEQEGLGTYLVIDDWKTPQPIREVLKQLHADKKAPLEGCALVGDIPVPMILMLMFHLPFDTVRFWSRITPQAIFSGKTNRVTPKEEIGKAYRG